jgi:hypothetical protein
MTFVNCNCLHVSTFLLNVLDQNKNNIRSDIINVGYARKKKSWKWGKHKISPKIWDYNLWSEISATYPLLIWKRTAVHYISSWRRTHKNKDIKKLEHSTFCSHWTWPLQADSTEVDLIGGGRRWMQSTFSAVIQISISSICIRRI